MRIGAHVPTRGHGPIGAIESARACGAEAVQIFGSNPRAWALPRIDRARCEAFRAAWSESGLGPLFLHSSYMVNVASPSAEFRGRSRDLATATVALADEIGADGVVVHSGAAGTTTPRAVALGRAVDTFTAVASQARTTAVLIELMAGGRGTVASTLPEARELFDGCDDHPSLGLCLDTCHLFAAGYGLDAADGVSETFAELRALGLEDRLKLVHANDSKGPRGAHLDRHTHIGHGGIGEDGFAAILAQPAVRHAAVVCETPGRLEDHARNVTALRRLAED